MESRLVIRRLDALTAARFFAAALIVLHHMRGVHGIPWDLGVILGQGVSFFFVLSGFILTYVYRDLSIASGLQVREFLHARAARIVPTHVATLALVLAILPGVRPDKAYEWGILAFNASLLHDWVPSIIFAFSYNTVAWSISAEAFFYLAFPVVVTMRRSIGLVTLLTGSILAVYLLTVGALPDVPSAGRLELSHKTAIHLHPVVRIWEFIVGVLFAKWYLRSSRVHSKRSVATGIELLALGLVALYFLTTVETVRAIRSIDHLGAFGEWYMRSGGALAFGWLVLVLAREEGVLSRLLCWRPLVFLGEISFAMYMVHQPILRYFRANPYYVESLPYPAGVLLIVALIVLVSTISYKVIELPIQAIWMGRVKGRSPNRSTRPPRFVIPAVISLAIVLFVLLSPVDFRPKVHSSEMIRFDSGLSLLSVESRECGFSYCVKTHWRANKDLRGNFAVVYESGERGWARRILGGRTTDGISAGTVWQEQVVLPTRYRLGNNVAISLRRGVTPLSACDQEVCRVTHSLKQ